MIFSRAVIFTSLILAVFSGAGCAKHTDSKPAASPASADGKAKPTSSDGQPVVNEDHQNVANLDLYGKCSKLAANHYADHVGVQKTSNELLVGEYLYMDSEIYVGNHSDKDKSFIESYVVDNIAPGAASSTKSECDDAALNGDVKLSAQASFHAPLKLVVNSDGSREHIGRRLISLSRAKDASKFNITYSIKARYQGHAPANTDQPEIEITDADSDVGILYYLNGFDLTEFVKVLRQNIDGSIDEVYSMSHYRRTDGQQ